MKKVFNKLNIIDLAVVIVVLGLLALASSIYLLKPQDTSIKMRVTIHVGSPAVAQAVRKRALEDKTVYLNGVNIPLEVEQVKEILDQSGKLSALDISLNGFGKQDENKGTIFNGQKILINQKAEIRGNYFAKGAVIEVGKAE